jgi:predicted nucleotidyltransferase
MGIGHVNPALAARLPLERIAELCQRYGVSELSVYGLGSEGDAKRAEEALFLVMFHNDDFGPWGCKLDQLENDLSGVMHEKVHVASRRGIEQSCPPPRRDDILANAKLIYKSMSPGARRPALETVP